MSHAASLERLLGEVAWQRLPAAVRARFCDPAVTVDYSGEFEIVRASPLGRLIAWFCLLFGTPVVPCTGTHIPAVVRVGPTKRGLAWNREYRWPQSSRYLVRSKKVVQPDGTLVEALPARLCMPLDVYESAGVLHFVSRGYYFRLGDWRLWLPHWLSPGTTHVEHEDEGSGWFRFTWTVRHPLLGEVFYQTGRFCAAGASTCSACLP